LHHFFHQTTKKNVLVLEIARAMVFAVVVFVVVHLVIPVRLAKRWNVLVLVQSAVIASSENVFVNLVTRAIIANKSQIVLCMLANLVLVMVHVIVVSAIVILVSLALLAIKCLDALVIVLIVVSACMANASVNLDGEVWTVLWLNILTSVPTIALVVVHANVAVVAVRMVVSEMIALVY